MIKGLSFRKKIFLGHILLIFLFLIIAFPFIGQAVARIAFNNLLSSSSRLIKVLQTAKDQNEMLQKLESSKEYIFFRASLFNDQGEKLYDSTLGENGDGKKNALMPLVSSELTEVIANKKVFSTGQSSVSHTKLGIVSQLFYFKGKTYILQTAVPFSQVEDLTEEFKLWFFIFCMAALLFFGSVTWLMFYRVHFPIRQIIRAIKPYLSRKEEMLSRISLAGAIDPEDDFYKLAETLNSLSERLEEQVGTITTERNEKEAILESLGEGVIAVDSEMQVRYINFIGSKMIGIAPHQIVGRKFPEDGEKQGFVLRKKCRLLLAACQEKMNALTDSILLEDGKKIYLDLVAVPKAEHKGAILVLQDKSSHYKVLEMGKDFVANASHELRTPITIIKGFAETLQDLPELPRDMVIDITEKIVRNCQRMDTLVKNLLTLADLENLPNSRFQQCDLVSLVESCRQIVLSVYENAEVVIEKSHESMIVAADPDILELAIINLMDNAAKYSNPPAHITIKLAYEGDGVNISIADRGIGISPTDLEHIFERFYTVDKARSRRSGGAGLGLSIVRTIIEKHYGTISVTSAIGQGTTFLIRLPIHHNAKYPF